MLKELREQACEANRSLPGHGIVHLNFGNASALDRARGILAIKPSGVDYAGLRPSDMVLVDLEGRVVEGRLRPSSDTPTHVELYRRLASVGGIVHTHSVHATAFAQAGRPIPALGTTHADFFFGEVPVTRALRRAEIERDYELNTGRVICERLARLDPAEAPGVLVRRHAPFAWGPTVGKAVENAVAIELCARMAFLSLLLRPSLQPIDAALLAKHFRRKHGSSAYYGQKPGPATSRSTRRP
jgi:L-ribulose-5-phosphate 4-epimerase